MQSQPNSLIKIGQKNQIKKQRFKKDLIKKAQEHCDSSFTTVFIDIFDFYKF